MRIPKNDPVPLTSRVYQGVVFQSAILHPVWKRREEKSPFPQAQNTERYPLAPQIIPLAVVVPENPVDQVARPVASDVRIFPSHGDQPVIFI